MKRKPFELMGRGRAFTIAPRNSPAGKHEASPPHGVPITAASSTTPAAPSPVHPPAPPPHANEVCMPRSEFERLQASAARRAPATQAAERHVGGAVAVCGCGELADKD